MGLGSPAPFCRLRGHASQVLSLEFVKAHLPSTTSDVKVEDEALLVSGDVDGWIRVWSVAERETIWRPSSAPHAATDKDPASGVIAVRAINPHDGLFLSQGKNGDLALWSLRELGHHRSVMRRRWNQLFAMGFCRMATCVQNFDGKEEILLACASFGAGEEMAVVYRLQPSAWREDGSPIDFELAKKADFQKVDEAKLGPCTCVSFVDGPGTQSLLLTGNEDGVIRLWDIKKENQVLKLSLNGPNDPILSCASFPGPGHGRRTFIAVGAGRTLFCSDVELDEDGNLGLKNESQTIDLRSEGHSLVTSRPDGLLFAVAGWNSKIQVYGATPGKRSFLQRLAVIRENTGGVQAMAWSTSSVLASSGTNGEITLVSLFSGGRQGAGT